MNLKYRNIFNLQNLMKDEAPLWWRFCNYCCIFFSRIQNSSNFLLSGKHLLCNIIVWVTKFSRKVWQPMLDSEDVFHSDGHNVSHYNYYKWKVSFSRPLLQVQSDHTVALGCKPSSIWTCVSLPFGFYPQEA